MVFPDTPNTWPSPGAPPPVRVVFGCESVERGEIYRQEADGLMGLGNNNNALQSQVCARVRVYVYGGRGAAPVCDPAAVFFTCVCSAHHARAAQLVAEKVIEDNFYLCFGFPNSGVLLLGECGGNPLGRHGNETASCRQPGRQLVGREGSRKDGAREACGACKCARAPTGAGDVKLGRSSEIAYTGMQPMEHTHYYTVTIDHVKVGGQRLNASAVSTGPGGLAAF